MDLRQFADHELLAEVGKLVGSHRELTAKLVAHLGEIEERRLHLQAGYPSMFEFCVRELKMSEGEAFRRILAARLGRRFPVMYPLLASGAVHLSALELLRERLTEENHAELLEAATDKSKREVEAMLAARFPRPDAPTRIRPLSEERFKVEFTASAGLRQKLELCRDLMSHANPSRELGLVIERAVDLLLAELEGNRLGRTKRPPREGGTRSAGSDRVTNAARREVYARDGLRCSYVSPQGRRCDARAFLELDHAEPRALGGGSSPDNLRVRCRAHNQLSAEQVFGRERVERCRHLRQQKCRPKTRNDEGGEHEARPAAGVSAVVLEKVRLALKGMGFRDAQARRAIAEVQRCQPEDLTVEQALRAALLMATAREWRAVG